MWRLTVATTFARPLSDAPTFIQKKKKKKKVIYPMTHFRITVLVRGFDLNCNWTDSESLLVWASRVLF